MPDERLIDTLQPRPRLWLGSVEFSAFEPRNGKMQRHIQHRAALAFRYRESYVSGVPAPGRGGDILWHLGRPDDALQQWQRARQLQRDPSDTLERKIHDKNLYE